MRRFFIDVVQFRLINGTVHAFALGPDDFSRFREHSNEAVFVSEGATRWTDRMPCEFALRMNHVEYLRYLREPAMLDDDGAVHFDSVPIDDENGAIQRDDDEDSPGGDVYAYFRGSAEPLAATVIADRAYLSHSGDAEEPGQLQHILDMIQVGEMETGDRFEFEDSDGEIVVLPATHLSLLTVPARIVDRTPNTELDEHARAARMLGSMRYAMDGLDEDEAKELFRSLLDDPARDPRSPE